jgi:type II secretory pathway component GspD/PulD (secretin)
MTVSVVIRPFKAGGVFYPAGTIIDPAGITLYKSRIGEGKIAVVDEHNLDSVSRFLNIRHGVEDAKATLVAAMNPNNTTHGYDPEYIEKVKKAAEQYEVEFEGRDIQEVVAEIKAKASR